MFVGGQAPAHKKTKTNWVCGMLSRRVSMLNMQQNMLIRLRRKSMPPSEKSEGMVQRDISGLTVVADKVEVVE